MPSDLCAGILRGSTTCLHCSRPLDGAAERCRCGGVGRDPRGPRHGLAEVFFPLHGLRA